MAKTKKKYSAKKAVKRKNNLHRNSNGLTKIEIRDVRNLILISLLMICGIFAFQKISAVPIHTIMVNSQVQHVDKQKIREVAAKYYQKGFFTVGLAKFEQELEQVPWVDQANIQRQWPNKLMIEITEQAPVFRWSKHELLNTKAEKFFVEDNSAFANLPLLSGSNGREKALARMYVEYNSDFRALNMPINSIVEDARYEKQIRLVNGILINVGKEQVDEKLNRLLRSFKEFKSDELAAIAAIDLRHSNGFSVRWNG